MKIPLRCSLLLLLVATKPALAAPVSPAISLRAIVSGFEKPVQLVDAHDHRPELYVAEQRGLIRIVDGSGIRPLPFLDIRSLVSSCDSCGILSIVFHPQYALNGRLFVLHTNLSGDTVIAEFRRSAEDPLTADPGFRRTLLTVDQPADNIPNHQGGTLVFGKDGFLYGSIGDGGANVVTNRAQELGQLLGKIIRIDVDRGDPYAIPTDNPFAGLPGARAEIWSYGLRNPWRFSFDPFTDLIFIGDVGQLTWEEVDIAAVESTRGANFGWPRSEGKHCFPIGTSCDLTGQLLPAIEYSRESGCSVTGGHRYRGRLWNRFRGMYLYGDFCSGKIWGATEQRDGSWSVLELLDTESLIVSFGEDDEGELYLVDYNGIIFAITDPPADRKRAARR